MLPRVARRTADVVDPPLLLEMIQVLLPQGAQLRNEAIRLRLATPPGGLRRLPAAGSSASEGAAAVGGGSGWPVLRDSMARTPGSS